MTVIIKKNQIEIKANKEDKRKLEKAAQIKHLSLASYISSTILKQADFDIQENELLMLNDKDADLIMNLLDSTTEPNDSLLNLFNT